jgi:hypothetical protein
MYSGVPHIIDLYNDSEDFKASVLQGANGAYVEISCRVKKELQPDSTGVVYVHITDGVQHMRLPVKIEVVDKKGKK